MELSGSLTLTLLFVPNSLEDASKQFDDFMKCCGYNPDAPVTVKRNISGMTRIYYYCYYYYYYTRIYYYYYYYYLVLVLIVTDSDLVFIDSTG
jgi:hypothetical protein